MILVRKRLFSDESPGELSLALPDGFSKGSVILGEILFEEVSEFFHGNIRTYSHENKLEKTYYNRWQCSITLAVALHIEYEPSMGHFCQFLVQFSYRYFEIFGQRFNGSEFMRKFSGQFGIFR